jgi:hypothetical protein
MIEQWVELKTKREESAIHACCLTTDRIPYVEKDRIQNKIIKTSVQ